MWFVYCIGGVVGLCIVLVVLLVCEVVIIGVAVVYVGVDEFCVVIEVGGVVVC